MNGMDNNGPFPPEAVRHSFDGHGWKYSDSGNGSDWYKRAMQHPDAEPLFALSQIEALTAERDALQAQVDGLTKDTRGNGVAAFWKRQCTEAWTALDAALAREGAVAMEVRAIKEAWKWWQADSYDRDAGVVVEAIDDALAATTDAAAALVRREDGLRLVLYEVSKGPSPGEQMRHWIEHFMTRARTALNPTEGVE